MKENGMTSAIPTFKRRCQHRPILPGRRQPSIVGTGELNYRVRNGNGWTLTVKDADYQTHSTFVLSVCYLAKARLVHLQGFEPGTH